MIAPDEVLTFWELIQMISQFICGEAGGATFFDQVDTGEVMRNRKLSAGFPNTWFEVLTQPKQFSSYNDGIPYHWGPPTQSCIDAAWLVATHGPEHVNRTGGALWFDLVESRPRWSTNMQVTFESHIHRFYK